MTFGGLEVGQNEKKGVHRGREVESAVALDDVIDEPGPESGRKFKFWPNF